MGRKEFNKLDMLFFVIGTAGVIKQYTKFHRIVYLLKKKLEQKDFNVNYSFEDRLFGGPFDKTLQRDIDYFCMNEFSDNVDKKVSPDSDLLTHKISSLNSTKLHLKGIEARLKRDLGKSDYNELEKYIRKLNGLELRELDGLIKEKNNSMISRELISFDELPKEVADLLRV